MRWTRGWWCNIQRMVQRRQESSLTRDRAPQAERLRYYREWLKDRLTLNGAAYKENRHFLWHVESGTPFTKEMDAEIFENKYNFPLSDSEGLRRPKREVLHPRSRKNTAQNPLKIRKNGGEKVSFQIVHVWLRYNVILVFPEGGCTCAPAPKTCVVHDVSSKQK